MAPTVRVRGMHASHVFLPGDVRTLRPSDILERRQFGTLAAGSGILAALSMGLTESGAARVGSLVKLTRSEHYGEFRISCVGRVEILAAEECPGGFQVETRPWQDLPQEEDGRVSDELRLQACSFARLLLRGTPREADLSDWGVLPLDSLVWALCRALVTEGSDRQLCLASQGILERLHLAFFAGQSLLVDRLIPGAVARSGLVKLADR